VTAVPTVPRELSRRAPGASPRSAASASAATSGSAALASAAPSASAAPWAGPSFAVTQAAAAIYAEPRFDKEKKLGYARNGGRLPVKAEPVGQQSCSKGWYELRDGGYVCGNQGTTDLNHPEVQFAMRAPALDDVLPYAYARNAKSGTPLYKSVPSREQMERYEPYLEKKSKGREGDEDDENESAVPSADKTASATQPAAAAPTPSDDGSALPTIAPEAAEADAGVPEQPWWQREGKDHLHKLKIGDLSADSDDVLASRMVAGFYVAVDKTFGWNDRTWYKTTRGLVAPADRFWQTAGFKFQGAELDGARMKLPIAWGHGGRKTIGTFEIDEARQKVKTGKSVDVFVALPLGARELTVGDTRYLELADGGFVKANQVRVARAATPPTDLAPNERWIDVNLSTQTLVMYEGTRPVFATLVSSGKQSSDKQKDHRTPVGTWRIREKHVTTTMDGDGTAAGDLPYSIEDVPYVMYYYNSYALHTAFWHRNFGVQMSHGCVNLSPLDAKRVFFFTDPPVPSGWHGAWSSGSRPGSRVVVHE
jgi:hypothetical protein